ncbi:hypothetical protein AB0I53_48795 [Saccharopolyspora sp. NPDC050389]|uniref:hypothetical protein n=1 Tax=Saccharopolyspora sp. NPDC050389 TaxID=3155516 RepID=UPI0033E0F4C9
MSSESTIDVVRQQLGEGRFVVLEHKATNPSSKKDRAATSEVWLVRPDGHLAWRGEPESPGLGQ